MELLMLWLAFGASVLAIGFYLVAKEFDYLLTTIDELERRLEEVEKG